MAKVIKNLNGHSGCTIQLVEDCGKVFVAKYSSSSKYNFRLKKQCKKQMMFKNTQNVFAPDVYSTGYDSNESFGFDMEYVKAKTLAELLPNIPIYEISDLIEFLFHSLYIESSKKDLKANMIFNKKIDDLASNLKEFENLTFPIKMLKEYDWSKVVKSPCHGDLTLENILISYDKKIYLIDFLDSFYNSWLIDIAKLLQDLETKWSYRFKSIDANTSIRLHIAKTKLIEKILQLENGQEYLETIYHLLLLNLVRIYPYAKEEETISFLNSAVEIVLGKISNIKGVQA